MVFHGSPARDVFQNNTTLRSTVFGYEGDDLIYGSKSSRSGDAIWGGSGNDTIYARGGNDYVNGEEGSDSIYGGAGNDNLFGGSENDFITGEIGNDKLYGDFGSDTLGAYWLRVGTQQGWVDELGDDILWGGIGNDTLAGGSGSDKLYGNIGFDDLWGDAGNDLLLGGVNDEQDTLHGGIGIDRFLSVADITLHPFYAREDRLIDRTFEDAATVFLDGYGTFYEDQIYTAQNWTEQDVLRVDPVLELLQREGQGRVLIQNSPKARLSVCAPWYHESWFQ